MVQSTSPASQGRARLLSFVSLWLCRRADTSRMGLASKAITVLFAISLCACEMKSQRAQTPPPPQPVPVKAEPAAETASNEPLSIPQTQVRLPSPQPINPEAIATPPVISPAEAAGAHPAHRPGRRPPPSTPPSVAPVKPEPVETVETP